MRVERWGGALGIRLPVGVVEALGLQECDDVEIRVADARSFEVIKRPSVEESLIDLRKLWGSLPNGFRFDRLEANVRD